MSATYKSVAAWVEHFNHEYESLQLPPENDWLEHELQTLAANGYDRQFLIEMSRWYACIVGLQAGNRQYHKHTDRRERLIAMPNLSWSRRKATAHIRQCEMLATEIERVLPELRLPGCPEGLMASAEWRECAEAPRILRAYSRLVKKVAEQAAIPAELQLKRDQFLLSMVTHVAHTRRYWPVLTALANCWGFCSVDEGAMRMQYARIPKGIPALTPKTRT